MWEGGSSDGGLVNVPDIYIGELHSFKTLVLKEKYEGIQIKDFVRVINSNQAVVPGN